jgi:L-lactate dehydrogenase complex protein LldG
MAATSKEKMLKKIRKALTSSTPQPFAASGDNGKVFQPQSQELDISFAEAFTKLQGQFSYCFDEREMLEQMLVLARAKNWTKWYCNDPAIRTIFEKAGWPLTWHNSLADCNVSITGCEFLVARTGTMVLSSTTSAGRTASVYAPAHICIAYSKQLVYDISDALKKLEAKYKKDLPSLISFASGPSRTADIEKTLVTGVHGPKEVYCFLLEKQGR